MIDSVECLSQVDKDADCDIDFIDWPSEFIY